MGVEPRSARGAGAPKRRLFLHFYKPFDEIDRHIRHDVDNCDDCRCMHGPDKQYRYARDTRNSSHNKAYKRKSFLFHFFLYVYSHFRFSIFDEICFGTRADYTVYLQLNCAVYDFGEMEYTDRRGKITEKCRSVTETARKINNPDASVGYSAQRFARYVLIRWLQSALIPFVTTRYVR